MISLGHLNIKTRILLLSIIPVISTVAMLFLNLAATNKLEKTIAFTNEVDIPKFKLLGEIVSARNDFGYNAWALLGNSSNANLRQQHLDAAKIALERFKSSWQVFESLPAESEREKELVGFVKKHKSEIDELNSTILDMLAKKSNDDDAVAKEFLSTEWVKMSAPLKTAVDETVKFVDDNKKEKVIAEKKLVARIQMISFGMGAVGLILIIFSLWYFGGGVAKVMSQVVLSIKNTVQIMRETANKLELDSTDLSKESVSSAASIEEAAASLEEISSLVKLTADNAREASDLSTTSTKTANQADEEIRKLVEAIKAISQSSSRVHEIVSVIDDISFQTNLLALNASVEAARAGEQGRGFAVVADAVRQLAHRSAGAAKEANTLVEDIIYKVKNGDTLADQSSKILLSIGESVRRVSTLNQEISHSAQEQSQGVTSISTQVNTLNLSVQKNAEASSSINSSSQELTSQFEVMEDVIKELNKVTFGNEAA